MSSRISKVAKKSVVIVVDKRDNDAYCSGCVMTKDRNSTTVIAPSDFVKGRKKHLKVVFSDRTELDATVVAVRGQFCSLKTPFHSRCVQIRLLEEDLVAPQWTFMFVPRSTTVNQKLSTYVTAESLEAYLIDHTILTANSTNYFMVSCAYTEKTLGGVNRLTATPVFSMLGETAGIILQDCREDAADPAVELKVALKATHLRDLMLFLDPPEPPSKQTKKRKRDCQ